jgi:hypothetical protein
MTSGRGIASSMRSSRTEYESCSSWTTATGCTRTDCRLRRRAAVRPLPRTPEPRPGIFRGRAAWEIWNEPNLPQFWAGTPDPAAYVALARAAAAEIRREDRRAWMAGANHSLALLRASRRAWPAEAGIRRPYPPAHGDRPSRSSPTLKGSENSVRPPRRTHESLHRDDRDARHESRPRLPAPLASASD